MDEDTDPTRLSVTFHTCLTRGEDPEDCGCARWYGCEEDFRKNLENGQTFIALDVNDKRVFLCKKKSGEQYDDEMILEFNSLNSSWCTDEDGYADVYDASYGWFANTLSIYGPDGGQMWVTRVIGLY